MTLQKLAPNLIATLVSWVTIGLVVAVTPPGAFIRDLVIVIAFLATAALWMTWAYVISGGGDTAAVTESGKAKRRAGSDPNVALLLELLTEDERAEIKERLLDRVQTDGEMTSLAELVGEQDRRARKSR